MRRRPNRLGLATATIVVVASLVTPTWAWARYRSPGAETNTFATHVLLAPGQPACGLINVLSVTLTWSAPSDASFVTSYDVGRATTSGGPYTYTNVGLALSTTVAAGLGNNYYVVRSEDKQWRGPNSPERYVLGAVVAASCP